MIVRLQIMKDGLQPFPMYAIVQKEEFSMKKGMKRLMSGLLAVAMVLTTFGVNTRVASAEERTMQNYVYDGFEVDFDVTDAWDGAFNADVKIANTGDAEICDWSLTFEFAHEIQNLWNATVVEHTGNTYVIKNADWNANIKPGEGVAFGMTVLYDGEIAFPESFSFVMEEESVTAQDYSAEFTLYSDWGTGCNGAIVLSNLTDEPIENWRLEFDYDREIVDIANAVIVSHEQGHYVIKNAEYNTDIAAKSSVHISLVAGEGAAEERPENFTMQQTVVGDTSNSEEGGSEGKPEVDDEEKEAIIAERLKGVKYTEPVEEHIKYDETMNICYVDNQVLVVTKEGVTLEEVEEFVSTFGATVVGYIVLTGDYQVEFSESKTLDELEGLVGALSLSEIVEDVMIHELFETSVSVAPEWYDEKEEASKWDEDWDTEFPQGANWWLEAIKAPEAWNYGGYTVKIGVVDSMFDENHEDLAFCDVLENADSVANKYELGFTLGRGVKDAAHGTHVAGMMAATHNDNGISGIANNAELYAASVYIDKESKMVGNKIIARESYMKTKYGFAWLILNECRVINYSMRGNSENIEANKAESLMYEKFLGRIHSNGYDFLIVQAAGNEGKDSNSMGSIAGITDVELRKHIIVVGAVELKKSLNISWMPDLVEELLGAKDGKLFTGYQYWSESNYGVGVDICAPGVDIYSTLPGSRYSNIFDVSNNEAELWAGTSQAAPCVSGVAALCFSVNPDLTGELVKEILCNSVTRYIDDTKGKCEHPLLDAEKAVKEALTKDGELNVADRKPLGVLEGQILTRIGFNSEREGTVSSVNNNTNGFVKAIPIDAVTGQLNMRGAIECTLGKLGTYELLLDEGYYHIIAGLEGYVEKEYPSVWIEGGKAVLYDIILVPDESSEESGNRPTNKVTGKITDVTSGLPIPDVTVNVIKGGYYGDGYNENPAISEAKLEIIDSVTTDENGMYSLQLKTGFYTLQLEKDGYITGYVEIVSAPNVFKQNGSISSKLTSNEYRIVLEWGSAPRDLDSHLVGNGEGSSFHVYYGQKICYIGDDVVAKLDIDDTSGYGPETVTVTVKVDDSMTYQYYVHDFSNRNNYSSSALSFSLAKVTLYSGNKQLKVYSVPIDEVGTRWNVFNIVNGKVIDVNTIE